MGFGGALSIKNSTLKNRNKSNRLQLNHCAFTDNTAGRNGGAIHLHGGVGQLFSCSFRNNSAFAGGAVFCENNGVLQVENCSFRGNLATKMAAVMGLHETTLTVSHSIISGNTCTFAGAIWFHGEMATMHIVESTISENNHNMVLSLTDDGIALYVTQAQHILLHSVLFDHNSGGGIALGDAFAEILNCSFLGNNGTAIATAAHPALLIIRHTSFVGNVPFTLHLMNSNIVVHHCQFVPAAHGSKPLIFLIPNDRTNVRLCRNLFVGLPTEHSFMETYFRPMTTIVPLIEMGTPSATYISLTLYLLQTFSQVNNSKVLITKSVMENASAPTILKVRDKINLTEEFSQFASGTLSVLCCLQDTSQKHEKMTMKWSLSIVCAIQLCSYRCGFRKVQFHFS